MKLSKCIKLMVLLLLCTMLFSPFSDAKCFSKKGKNRPITNAKPFEIDEEFKGEFEYFDAKAQKQKVKEEKTVQKIEKKHQKLLKKKKKLELKQQKSVQNLEKFTDYKEKLENTFLPANSTKEE